MKPHYPSPREIDQMRQAGHRRHPGQEYTYFGRGLDTDMHPLHVKTWDEEREFGIPLRWRRAERA